MENANTFRPIRPEGPLLSQLAGMAEARAWGEGLIQDLRLYRDHHFQWEDIDAGCVLYGPPGTGKTTYAKALAASSGLPLIATSYGDWGRGSPYASAAIDSIKELFGSAARHAPCIVAIDELDSIPSRAIMKSENTIGATMIVNALLAEMDGIKEREGIVVIGMCNHPDKLDPALVRSGRLGRSIQIPLPDTNALTEILAFHLKGDAKTVGSLPDIAVMCAGLSGADVEQLVREARQVARRRREFLGRKHFDLILEKRISGLSEQDLWRVAVHETGHGVAAHVLQESRSITLSIVPSSGTFGRAILQPPRGPMSRTQLTNKLIVLLAGRAAEQVLIGDPSSGAGGDSRSDLARASDLALRAVLQLGLSESGSAFWHGQFSDVPISACPEPLYAEAVQLVDQASQAAKTLMEERRSPLLQIAHALLERRALSQEAFYHEWYTPMAPPSPRGSTPAPPPSVMRERIITLNPATAPARPRNCRYPL